MVGEMFFTRGERERELRDRRMTRCLPAVTGVMSGSGMYPRPAARNQPHSHFRACGCMYVLQHAGNREPGWPKIFGSYAAHAACAILFLDGAAAHTLVGTLASLVRSAKEETEEQVERVCWMISSTYSPSLSLQILAS